MSLIGIAFSLFKDDELNVMCYFSMNMLRLSSCPLSIAATQWTTDATDLQDVILNLTSFPSICFESPA